MWTAESGTWSWSKATYLFVTLIEVVDISIQDLDE